MNRPNGMSLLDYLWTTYGEYEVSNEASTTPRDNTILTEKALTNLILSTATDISKLVFRDHPTKKGVTLLIGLSTNGSELSVVEMPKEVHVLSFLIRKITQIDIDNNINLLLDSLVLSLVLTDETEHLVSLSDLNLVRDGADTSTIATRVTNGTINSHLKVDSGNNNLSPIKINTTDLGIYSDIKISLSSDGITITKESDGLAFKIPVENLDTSIKFSTLTLALYQGLETKNPSTVYFISDLPYIYFGETKYGNSIELGETSSTAYPGDKGKQNANNIATLQNTTSSITTVMSSNPWIISMNNIMGASYKEGDTDVSVPLTLNTYKYPGEAGSFNRTLHIPKVRLADEETSQEALSGVLDYKDYEKFLEYDTRITNIGNTHLPLAGGKMTGSIEWEDTSSPTYMKLGNTGIDVGNPIGGSDYTSVALGNVRVYEPHENSGGEEVGRGVNITPDSVAISSGEGYNNIELTSSGVKVYNKTTSDLLTAAGGTTSISDISPYKKTSNNAVYVANDNLDVSGLGALAFGHIAYREGPGLTGVANSTTYTVNRLTAGSGSPIYKDNVSYKLSEYLIPNKTKLYDIDNIDNIATVLSVNDDELTVTLDKTINPDSDWTDFPNCRILNSASGLLSVVHGCGYSYGDLSITLGGPSVSNGYGSLALGEANVSNGRYSITLGRGLVARNNCETSVGQFNYSHSGETSDEQSVFTIGVGDTVGGPKNAIEVTKSGGVYVSGVGEYSGTSIEGETILEVILSLQGTVESLNSLISEMLNKILELESKVDSLSVL